MLGYMAVEEQENQKESPARLLRNVGLGLGAEAYLADIDRSCHSGVTAQRNLVPENRQLNASGKFRTGFLSTVATWVALRGLAKTLEPLVESERWNGSMGEKTSCDNGKTTSTCPKPSREPARLRLGLLSSTLPTSYFNFPTFPTACSIPREAPAKVCPEKIIDLGPKIRKDLSLKYANSDKLFTVWESRSAGRTKSFALALF
ncbi:uncharacterized protein EV420DRAFT_1689814 [Desarmillaria tabescens]|uniref:Uncharacterized protein n=1 Tax=Armillaria tabescens TaxID=1929756 RepID=A0AA39N4L0_ARMTA|nr:uncharacterized protein EV420DRAFT_1689814 [Desarmillaria tabescens]KAK0457219.1 hypothetical protein EV420DRAFT_1689814 [Desarmillaria tabescens]